MAEFVLDNTDSVTLHILHRQVKSYNSILVLFLSKSQVMACSVNSAAYLKENGNVRLKFIHKRIFSKLIEKEWINHHDCIGKKKENHERKKYMKQSIKTFSKRKKIYENLNNMPPCL